MFTSAKFLKFRGTSDSGWLRFKLGGCGAVDNVFMLFCDSSYVFGVVDNFVLHSFICASKSILFIDVENVPKKSCKKYACYARLSIDLYVDCACVINAF